MMPPGGSAKAILQTSLLGSFEERIYVVSSSAVVSSIEANKLVLLNASFVHEPSELSALGRRTPISCLHDVVEVQIFSAEGYRLKSLEAVHLPRLQRMSFVRRRTVEPFRHLVIDTAGHSGNIVP